MESTQCGTKSITPPPSSEPKNHNCHSARDVSVEATHPQPGPSGIDTTGLEGVTLWAKMKLNSGNSFQTITRQKKEENMHHLVRAEDIRLESTYVGNSKSFSRCSLVDASSGSVHMGLGLCALQAGGLIDTHVHSFEESFYVLKGQPVLVLDGSAHALVPGACGLVPVGVPHAWLGPTKGSAKWIDMLAPQPRVKGAADDTFFMSPPEKHEVKQLDIRDPRSRHLFRMAESDIDLDKLKAGSRVNAPTVSASMSTALLAYSGIALKMLVDQRLDAQLSTMFMVEYQPGGVAHPHDHPLEESYVILAGEVEAIADDTRYTLRTGDVFWTGVGCIHAFYNTSKRTVRWLETQSPQLPARYGYRFSRDWEYLKENLAVASSPKKSKK
jgi:quercetin dioxygenase-like cupin family protein